MSDQFAQCMEPVARHLLGDPNRALSNATELRFGSSGSLKVDLKRGVAYSFSDEKGGGVLWLVERELGLKGAAAVAWLQEQGFLHEDTRTDDRPAPRTGKPAAPQPPKLDERLGRPDRSPGAAPADAASRAKPAPAQLVCTYDYVDEAGHLIFQVLRYEPKTFIQRQPYKGTWAWSITEGYYRFDDRRGEWFKLKGDAEPQANDAHLPAVRQVPYRLPEVVEAIANGHTVYVVEGEKDADNLWERGIPATCNAAGSGKWPEELSPHFWQANVVLLPDNDAPGRKHRDLVGAALKPVSASVRVLELPGLPEKGDVSDWFAAGGSVEELARLTAEAATEFGYEPYKPNFRLEFWGDLFKPGPKHEWLVKGLLSRGELSMLAGASQSGKSFLTLHLAMAVCRGTEFLGHKVVRPGGVVYQAGEGYAGFRDLRISAYVKENGLGSDANLPLALIGSPIDLFAGDADTDALIADIKHIATLLPVPLELVVIDTLSAATPGANENASEHVSMALKRCDRIRRATGANVLLVHHMNSDGSKARGHTSLTANLETVMQASVLPDMHDRQGRKLRELSLIKQKDGDPGHSTRFVLRSTEIRQDEEGEPVTSCVVDLPASGEGLSAQPVSHGKVIRMSPQAKIMMACIEAAIAKHPEPQPPGEELPPGQGGTSDPHIRRLFDARMGDGGKEDKTSRSNRVRKAWERQSEFLQSVGLIVVSHRYVWRTWKAWDSEGFVTDVTEAPSDEEVSEPLTW